MQSLSGCTPAVASTGLYAHSTQATAQARRKATTIGYDNHLWPAEVGAGLVVNDPGAVAEPVDRVIWSPLAMPVLPGNDPWSSSELAALQRIGVVLPSASERLDRIAATWLRPVMAACKQLVLVLPAQGSGIHPLWQMINAVAKAPKVLSLEAFLSSGGEAFAPVSPQPLPAPQRWWCSVAPHVQVNLRPKESFSSLEKLLFNPYQWLLQYPAKLQPSRTIGLGGDFRILGNLAHKLVEQYFLHPHALSMEAAPFDTWFASSFDALVDQEGAILKSPGRGRTWRGFATVCKLLGQTARTGYPGGSGACRTRTRSLRHFPRRRAGGFH